MEWLLWLVLIVVGAIVGLVLLVTVVVTIINAYIRIKGFLRYRCQICGKRIWGHPCLPMRENDTIEENERNKNRPCYHHRCYFSRK